MTLLVKVRTQENGAMLPLAFQGVLFLDVFGWVKHMLTLSGRAHMRAGVQAPAALDMPAVCAANLDATSTKALIERVSPHTKSRMPRRLPPGRQWLDDVDELEDMGYSQP